MKEWKIPVTWEMCGEVYARAATLKEAMQKVADDEEDYPLPPDGNYVEGSWGLSYGMEQAEEVRSLFNDGQEDELNRPRKYHDVIPIGYALPKSDCSLLPFQIGMGEQPSTATIYIGEAGQWDVMARSGCYYSMRNGFNSISIPKADAERVFDICLYE